MKVTVTIELDSKYLPLFKNFVESLERKDSVEYQKEPKKEIESVVSSFLGRDFKIKDFNERPEISEFKRNEKVELLKGFFNQRASFKRFDFTVAEFQSYIEKLKEGILTREAKQSINSFIYQRKDDDKAIDGFVYSSTNTWGKYKFEKI